MRDQAANATLSVTRWVVSSEGRRSYRVRDQNRN